MNTPTIEVTRIERHAVGQNIWLRRAGDGTTAADFAVNEISPIMLDSEVAVGHAMFEEIKQAAREETGDLNIIILGGRGGQALHRLIGEKARTEEIDELLGRLNVFTQDALAPMRMDNSFSFVRDFERLLGPAFFSKVKSFTSMHTEAIDLEAELSNYLERLESVGKVDIFFLGLGPEANSASHLAYIKPGSGATAADLAGVIPISTDILRHHIAKFKAGGASVNEADEAECRSASHILTLGPAAILGAKRIVQSIVDAATAPAKPACYQRLIETEIAADPGERSRQVNANPGLWLRLHPQVRSLVLPNVVNKGQRWSLKR